MTVTVFTTRETPRALKLLEWLGSIDPERRMIAAQEARVRLAALDDLRFWLERWAGHAAGRLRIQWIDREAQAGLYQARFVALGLQRDVRIQQRLDVVSSPHDSEEIRGIDLGVTGPLQAFPGLVRLMRAELSEAAMRRWLEPRVCGLRDRLL